MAKKKYDFISYDLEYKRKLEKKRGSKIPDEKFYRYIQKQKKWLKEFAEAVKKWMIEKPPRSRATFATCKKLGRKR